MGSRRDGAEPLFSDDWNAQDQGAGQRDGLSIDQIALSPVTYMNTSPGTLMNDTIILPKSTGPSNTRPTVQVLNRMIL